LRPAKPFLCQAGLSAEASRVLERAVAMDLSDPWPRRTCAGFGPAPALATIVRDAA